MRRRLAPVFVAALLLPAVPVADDSTDWNFSIQVERSFPKEMRYVTLREHVADLLRTCRLDDTSGGRDMELLETFESIRRPLARTILDQLVDDEFVPAHGESVEAQYRARVVVIDPFVFGLSRFRSGAVPDGFTVEVSLEGHLLLALIARTSAGPGGHARYSIGIWDWDSDDPHKTCGFAYDR